MGGEGSAGKVGLASGHVEGSGFKSAADTICPGFALRWVEAMPPLQGRFRLGFCYDKGRGVVRALLAAASALVAFILRGGFRRIMGVFPVPVEAHRMDSPAPLFEGHFHPHGAVVINRLDSRIEDALPKGIEAGVRLLGISTHECPKFVQRERPVGPAKALLVGKDRVELAAVARQAVRGVGLDFGEV